MTNTGVNNETGIRSDMTQVYKLLLILYITSITITIILVLLVLVLY